MTKTTKILAIATVTALTGLASAQAQSRVTPILRAEVTYTNTGYRETFAPKGYEAGPGLTAGVLIDKVHEVSISTGYTKFEGKHNFIPADSDAFGESEQIPLLLSYRYNFALDQAGRFTVFAGPTVGFIHEKFTQNNTDLGGGGPAALFGSDSSSKFKLAYGATVGVKASIGKRWDIGASAQLLKVEGNTFTNHSGLSTAKFDDATRPSFALSVGYSW
jgi:hypothetical protein